MNVIDFSSSALLEIDIQNDFCPGGALAVNRGDEVIDILNRLARLFAARGGRVAATQDWHTENHISFASSHPGRSPGDSVDLPCVKGQILWPDHCVQDSAGADFHKDLDLKPVNLIIRKGFRPDLDSYSAFFENDRKTETGLKGFFKGLSVDTVFIGGLATDYCVFYSAMDAAKAGFKTFVIEDAVRGVGFPEGSVERALETLKNMGITLINSGEIV
ncbi:MAG: bifunctional nicotinamidase/pyrazinamidase [Treponema sp.]|jgi:nicotinamidase/pyrazinamidase|nr:bifunctional nicotinamidase/pyrazinamidase [Treponema sp.]